MCFKKEILERMGTNRICCLDFWCECRSFDGVAGGSFLSEKFFLREKIKKPEVFLYATKVIERTQVSTSLTKSHTFMQEFLSSMEKLFGKHCLEGLKSGIYCYCLW